MSYQERGLEWSEDGSTWSGGTIGGPIQYPLDFDATSTEGIIEEEPITGDRDAVSQVDSSREITGRFEAQFMSPKLFYYVLGSLSSKTIDPYTISPAATIPYIYFRRGLSSPNNIAIYEDCKIDSARISLEVGEDVTYELNFVSSWSTLQTTSYSAPSIDFSKEPFVFYEGKLTRGGTVVTDLQSIEIEISNNLEARYSADSSLSRPRGPYKIREGRLAVTGRFTAGETVEPIIQSILKGNRFDLVLTLVKGSETVTITLKNARITEWSDAISGRDVYEVEFPFSCRPTSGLDIMSIVHNGKTWVQAVP